MDVRFKQHDGDLPMALLIAIPFGLILLGEALLYNGDLEACSAVHLFNILVCVLAPILLKQNALIWQAFLPVSLIRVLNLAMPTFNELTLLWMPLIYAPVILVGFMMVRDESRRLVDYLRDLGRFFNVSRSAAGWKIYYLPIALIIALVAANIEFNILGLSISDLRMIPELSWEYMGLLFVVMVFFVGLGEELVFRYILQARLQASVGIVPALLISSLAFALMHSGYTSIIYMIYVFCISLVFGLIYYKTKSLAFVSLIHGTLNFLLFSLLPFGYLQLI